VAYSPALVNPSPHGQYEVRCHKTASLVFLFLFQCSLAFRPHRVSLSFDIPISRTAGDIVNTGAIRRYGVALALFPSQPPQRLPYDVPYFKIWPGLTLFCVSGFPLCPHGIRRAKRRPAVVHTFDQGRGRLVIADAQVYAGITTRGRGTLCRCLLQRMRQDVYPYFFRWVAWVVLIFLFLSFFTGPQAGFLSLKKSVVCLVFFLFFPPWAAPPQ